MERRKMLIGMGTLAAGGAGVLGTGAVTSFSADRYVNAAVVADEEAFITLTDDLTLPTPASDPDDDSDAPDNNTEYATGSGDGMLRLVFNDESGASGSGLNTNATYYFDNVFGIRNEADGDQLKVDLNDSGLDNPDAFQFYSLSLAGDVLVNRETFFSPGIDPGFGINVGVKIETPMDLDPNWETGTVEIIAEDTDESSSDIQI